MSEMMTFPDTWEEFEKSYGFTDNEEVYTNGARLIPSFRVKQWLDHLPSAQPNLQLTCNQLATDCISRQDAIAEFSCCELTPDGGIDANYAIDFLKQLPSVQPETNCSEIPNSSDSISRRAAIDALKQMRKDGDMVPWEGKNVFARIRKMPSAQPDIIRCRNCKFASGDSRICMKFGHSPIGELDFCAWAERRTDE